jgi:hypothetical protein
MAELSAGIQTLILSADGRSAVNWRAYSEHVINYLSGKESNGIYLDNVLKNRRSGRKPEDPGEVEAACIAAAPRRNAND